MTADTRPAATFDLEDNINRIVSDRAVKVARNRPPPWSTRHDHIPWSGQTDRSDNARLLPAKPAPTVAAIGTRRPPLAAVVALCAAARPVAAIMRQIVRAVPGPCAISDPRFRLRGTVERDSTWLGSRFIGMTRPQWPRK